MELADQTLHDFVLNLLSDSQALAAFEQDPAAMLDHAGLSDISAADVQEVIPLVIDYVPAHADTLDAALSQLPVDSLDTGQLGAIQQLQFVTQALGGMPSLDQAGSLGNAEVNGAYHVAANAEHGFLTGGELTTPVGGITGAVAGDLVQGVTASFTDTTMVGKGADFVRLPGLSGLPSMHAAGGDVADLLDGQNATGSVTNSVTMATNVLTGAADLAAGGLANPQAVAAALSDPSTAFSAVNGIVSSYGAEVSAALPAPASDVANTVLHTVDQDTQGVGNDVAANLHTGPLSGVTGQVPLSGASGALGPVQGVVDQVTSHLPTGSADGLASTVQSTVQSTLSDPTHAVQSTVTSVQGTVSDTVGSATHGGTASQSVVSDVTNATGTGDIAGSTHGDPLGAVTDSVHHVTSDLHLPLF